MLLLLLNNALLLNRRDSSVLRLSPTDFMLDYLVRVEVHVISLDLLEQGSYTGLSIRNGGLGLLQ